ncbi:hypothetical protein NCCP2222_19540 [Sporosarcina sp. NCCP-2222]|uniref:hypothetical protein n=1 Tax=Sporosarcina sp. NCCP-2222 TaxID=2935073 RepID=UPI00208AB908|nr:hypothetical protein [Sporosarcina sp. NCCP-2222]GKV56007.1 hypothetical protein NCCP2222_19540 [Sporosarcina sp. NCCP-2222]
MVKLFQWEIRSMGEQDPYTVHTEKDDVLAAVTQFVEQYPTVSVYSVRKSAEIIQYKEAI